MPLSTNCHREFLFKFVPMIENENIKFTFIPTYRREKVVSVRYLFKESDGRSFGFDLDVTEDIEENSSLVEILHKIEDVKFDNNNGFSANVDFKNIISGLRVRIPFNIKS